MTTTTGALTLPKEAHDQRDFKAGAVISLPKTPIPEHYSLGQFVAKTNYQNGWGSCTANSTSHALQAMAVNNKYGPVKGENKITIDRKYLWEAMGHSLEDKSQRGDYVENALKGAIKGVKDLESDNEFKLKGYSYEEFKANDAGFEEIKRYLANGYPLIFVIQGDKDTWNQMNKGEVKDISKVSTAHAVCCVGYDANGLWFLNSWRPNDGIGDKSRFYMSFTSIRGNKRFFNWRYFVPFYSSEVDVEHIKQENMAIIITQALQKLYAETSYSDVKEGIISVSKALRNRYKRIDKELPL